MKRNQKGFTLIELLVVLGILTILLAVVLIAVNPARQLAQSRDTRRRADIVTILNAIDQHLIASGTLPCSTGGDCVSTTFRLLGTAISGCSITCKYVDSNGVIYNDTTNSICLDIKSALVPKYIAAMPFDPLAATTTTSPDKSYYAVKVLSSSDNRIVVAACNAEIESMISVLR